MILKSITISFGRKLGQKIYYIGQGLADRKIFTQSLIEKYSKFSSTTIRKKYHILKESLGDPQKLKFDDLNSLLNTNR